MQHFIFEVQSWEPEYWVSVNHERHGGRPYSEHVGIDINGSCVLPRKLSDRSASFHLVGERNYFNPDFYGQEPDWRPRCVGELDLRPGRGSFYSQLPHDAMPSLLSGLAAGSFRYILLWGPPLRWGKPRCTSIDLRRSVFLEDYGE
jgi:hypothetical protein